MMRNVQYLVCDVGLQFPEDAFSLGPTPLPVTIDSWEVEFLARAAAEEYWSDHDGWEASWPLDFEIFIDGKSYGICAVDMEAQPVFSANIKQERAS